MDTSVSAKLAPVAMPTLSVAVRAGHGDPVVAVLDEVQSGGDDDLRAALEANRTTPEPVKAAAHAKLVRPD